MSLHDQFYPDDGDWLTHFDNTVIKVAGNIAETYQSLMGSPLTKQVKNSHIVAGAGSLVTLYYNLWFGAYSNFVSFCGFMSPPKIQSPLEEEIELESQLKSKDSGKKKRLINLATLPLLFAAGYVLRKETGVSDTDHMFHTFGEALIVQSLAWIPDVYAMYASKADIPQPPEKSVYDKAKNFFRVSAAKQPEMRPIPIQYP
ncbi:hypothetical protein HZB02_07195 [Candidatus Woesearchaeota archaeon]|nr:hypothetical protein [Candidatus Woesearchaeota archaeon]